MTPFDALAAAIRERLTAGRPAPLPGLGTLVRQHVSARVEERADGTRVLLPPGETIGLAPTDGSHESLAPAFGRLLALPDREVPQAYSQAADQLEARLAATGEVRLPGVGLLRRTSGGVILGVEADLLAAVNRAYEGLSPVSPSRSSDEIPAASAPPPPPDAPAPDSADAPSSPPGVPEQSDADAPEDDPFMIGLPPVDAAGASSHKPGPSDTPAAPLAADAWESAPPDAPEDDAFEIPVTADAADFGFAPAVAPSVSAGDPPAADGPPAPPPSVPDDKPSMESPDAEDDLLPEPFDAGDLSTEPMLASDLVPLAAEPPEPDEPFTDTFSDADTSGDDAAAPHPMDDVHEASFVDGDTLDADLDDVLAVPFGRLEDDPVAEVLPPSVPGDEADGASPEARTPGSDEDDWVAETWTAAGTAPPVGLDDANAGEIEDAEVIEDSEVTGTVSDAEATEDVGAVEAPDMSGDPFRADEAFAAPAVDPAAPPESPPEEATRADAPPASPDAEFEALLAPPPDEPPPVIVADAPPPAAAAEPTAAASRRSPWSWILALVLLAGVAAAALWLWPRLSGRDADVVTEVPPTRVAVPPVEAPAPAEVAPVDSLAAPPESDAPPAPASPPTAETEAPRADAPPSRDGGTFAPPRLEGLDAGDRRALTGPPIDPSMGGWTLVVASLRSEAAATELEARYRTAGYRTAVFPPSGRTVTRYRIGVGQFGSRDQARRLLDRVFEYEPGGTWPLNLRTL